MHATGVTQGRRVVNSEDCIKPYVTTCLYMNGIKGLGEATSEQRRVMRDVDRSLNVGRSDEDQGYVEGTGEG